LPLETEVFTVSGIAVIRCGGRIVYGPEMLAFQNQVEGLLLNSGRCVLNLSGVSQIDACGVGSLMAGHSTARELGGSMKVAGVCRRVYELLELTRVANVLEIYPHENDAVRASCATRLAARSFHTH
jgi:anti-anti-sigma factor